MMIDNTIKLYISRRKASGHLAIIRTAQLRVATGLVFSLLLVGSTGFGYAQDRIKAQRPTETLSQFAERTLREERTKESHSKEARRKEVQARTAQSSLERRSIETRIIPKRPVTTSRARHAAHLALRRRRQPSPQAQLD